MSLTHGTDMETNEVDSIRWFYNMWVFYYNLILIIKFDQILSDIKIYFIRKR
jgi:hypothetical protein